MDQADQKLFFEFPPVTTPEWEEKIRIDLKGSDYEKKLVWNTDEGFPVRPYYRAEDLEGLEYLGPPPGKEPYVRGVKKDLNDWIIRQDIPCTTIEEANAVSLDALSKGVNALGICAREITTHKQMSQLLDKIDLAKTSIHFIASRSYPLTLELFIYEINHRGLEGDMIRGSINFDPVSYLLLNGDFYISRENNFEEAEYLVTTAGKKLPNFRVITVNGHYFNNAGSTIVQELAFSLASAHEYLYQLNSRGHPADIIAPKIMFSFGVGSNYFLEIAKLRAARLLWSKIIGKYNPSQEETAKMFIHSITSMWNKTIYDPYVNMLRTTTEGMAAAIGNTDSLTILPFDQPFRDPDEFSRRIARNQQLILKEEAYLDKIVDPSAGSYYIENLTHSIAVHAWNLFKKVEEKGGIVECIKDGYIQDEIEKACRKKETDISRRKIVMIGTNQYPNLMEPMVDDVTSVSAPLPGIPSRYRKLKLFRGTQEYEALRLATEIHVKKGSKKPEVFLLTLGSQGMRQARATFATNFFGCAGYGIIDNPGFNTVDEGIQAALESEAEIVVICSSDEEYAAIVPEITAGIKEKRPETFIVVAGYPESILETLKAAGVDDFIHIRSNVVEVLEQVQRRLGIMK